MINGYQCTIQWYVGDNEVTYISEDLIIGVINIMNKHFVELSVSSKKKHTFHGMDI